MVLILIQSPGFASHNGALGGGSDTYRSSVCVGFISVHNLLGAQEMVAHVLTIKRWGLGGRQVLSLSLFKDSYIREKKSRGRRGRERLKQTAC